MRLFVAISLPPTLRQTIALSGGGIEGARWIPEHNLHLTLRFLGEVHGKHAAIHDALAKVRAPSFELSLKGAGVFPPRGQPKVLWLGVAPPRPLHDLYGRVDRALGPLGLDLERRNYTPHVTVARLARSPERKVAAWVASHALYDSPPFVVDRFELVSSVLHPAGPRYAEEASYPLDAPESGSPMPDST